MRKERKEILSQREDILTMIEMKKLDLQKIQLELRILEKDLEKNKYKESEIGDGFILMSWNQLEEYLIRYHFSSPYEQCPVVRGVYDDDTFVYDTYCCLVNNPDGEGKVLQVGAYFHNDRHKRGSDLLVNVNRKWRG